MIALCVYTVANARLRVKNKQCTLLVTNKRNDLLLKKFIPIVTTVHYLLYCRFAVSCHGVKRKHN